jgi:osmotically inducible protein OsmC
VPTRTASATWRGGLKGGTGSYKGETGISGNYSFGSRFEEAGGSNPEELLASAEAACFSGALEKNGTPPTSVETTAKCTVEKVGDGFTITTMALQVNVAAPQLDEATLKTIADKVKDGCPVSRALANNVKITVDAHLV